MTGSEHYRRAESCLASLGERGPDEDSPALLAEAQVHATLALAAATIDVAFIADRLASPDAFPPPEWERDWTAATS